MRLGLGGHAIGGGVHQELCAHADVQLHRDNGSVRRRLRGQVSDDGGLQRRVRALHVHRPEDEHVHRWVRPADEDELRRFVRSPRANDVQLHRDNGSVRCRLRGQVSDAGGLQHRVRALHVHRPDDEDVHPSSRDGYADAGCMREHVRGRAAAGAGAGSALRGLCEPAVHLHNSV